MNLPFLNLGMTEFGILSVILLFIVALGNYGRNTALGYWGSVLLCFLASPLGAFLVITYLKLRSAPKHR
ncbi:hypothetical protein ACTHQF_15005 [Pedobacter sp. SAFR-022]|uniref:hypothetical protein n=1 Tax=Pedobacter sp. SAFR-022 TaxID=3436861 RepID=UPI003F81711F